MPEPPQFAIDRTRPGQWTITFSNPPINMFVPATIIELGAVMTELEADPSVKVAVFQSANPDFFVAHLDVSKAVQEPGVLDLWRDFVLRLSSSPVVSITKIRGRTRGIGNEFVLACDMRSAYGQLTVLFAKRRAYAQMMATRPQTLYGLEDSPVGLAAWMFDHGDGYGQPAAAVSSAVLGRAIHGHPVGALTRDDVLDDFTLYWLTNTAVSAARYYWESHINLYNAADVSIPAAVSVFPGENYQAPRIWAERAYHKLIYFNEVDQGGHYASWEQPKLFSEEVRAGFRPLRGTLRN